MRLTLIIPGLRGGGAERVLSTLANAWVDAGHIVTFLTLEHDGPKEFELAASIHYRPLPLASVSANPIVGLTSNLRRLRILRSAIRESHPHVIVSFTSSANVLTILAATGLGVRVIVSERSDPWQFEIGRIWSALRSITYPFADAVVYQTESVAARLRRSTRQKIVVIPNPVALRKRTADSGTCGPVKQIFAMGRLDPVKGFDLLLHAFGSIARQHPDWSLRILGEGYERENLERLAASLGLSDRVSLPGWVSEPFSLLAEAELFVLSSRVEGFPNALCEAMACGVPVIAFNCQSGPADIVRHEVDGLLIPPQDVHALAFAMDRLMCDPGERARLGLRAPDVIRRFGSENVLQRWRQLFDQVTPADSHRRHAISARAE